MTGDDLAATLKAVVDELDKLGITHAVTGSLASSIHGEPVTSLDVDIVVRMSEVQARQIANDLSGRFYADPDALVEAAKNYTFANVMDNKTGFKIDLSALSSTPYHNEVLARRVQVVHPGTKEPVWVVSPEDIILMKLVWRMQTRSQKQWDNALSVVRTQRARLDWQYLRDWARELGVLNDLDELMREAGI